MPTLLRKFKAPSEARPVWLATGSAWTEVDLADTASSAEDNRLLTDLVIDHLPLRTSTSIQHARALSMSNARGIEATFKFWQGIGRLMRREGVRDRRIWVLDGRVVSSERTHKFLTGMIRRVLADYDQTKHFPLPASCERSGDGENTGERSQ